MLLSICYRWTRPLPCSCIHVCGDWTAHGSKPYPFLAPWTSFHAPPHPCTGGGRVSEWSVLDPSGAISGKGVSYSQRLWWHVPFWPFFPYLVAENWMLNLIIDQYTCTASVQIGCVHKDNYTHTLPLPYGLMLYMYVAGPGGGGVLSSPLSWYSAVHM